MATTMASRTDTIFIDSPHGEAGITIFTMHVRVFVNELCTLVWSPYERLVGGSRFNVSTRILGRRSQ
jgi:hypothetical protein